MTEQEYDEQIAPVLLELAQKAQALGGHLVARVEWGPDASGFTASGDLVRMSVGQKLAYYAIKANGNLDALVYALAKVGDLSQTIVGHAMGLVKTTPSAATEGSSDA